MTSNRIAKFFVTFVVLWIGLSVVGYWIGRAVFYDAELERLEKNGKEIYGQVTGKHPEEHQTIEYTYTVNGREYAGTGSSDEGNPPFENIQIGDHFIVVYDPEDPEQSISGYPQERIIRNKTGVYFVTATFPVIPMAQIVVIYLAIRLYKRPAKRGRAIGLG